MWVYLSGTKSGGASWNIHEELLLHIINSCHILGHSTFAAQTSLSEAADAILGASGDEKGHAAAFDTSPGAVAKNLLGKFTHMRKASILSGSSIGSFGEKKSNSSTEDLHANGKSKSEN